jgi:hypothetical protein
MRFAAVCLFLSGFGAKIFAPFSQKDVDWNELHHHAALALKNAPPEKLPHLMAELTSLYMQSVKDPYLTFGEAYQSLKNDLEKEWSAASAPADNNAKPVVGAHTAALRASQAERLSAPAARTALK